MSRGHDALVVGGGLAGAAFATSLAEAGRDVVLIERETGPHDKVCGEFLSGQALRRLGALGLDVEALGAEPIRRVRLSRGAMSAGCDLPFQAASLSRLTLDEALLARAAEAGATILRGRAAQALDRSEDGWTVRLQDGETVAAKEAALACGKHDLRGRGRPEGLQNDLIGLKTYLRLAPSQAATLCGAVLLGFFPGGYAGLEPVEGGCANLCLVVRGRAFAALGRDWSALLDVARASAPELGAALEGAQALRERPLAVARIPYGLVTRDSPDGCWRLGDQAAVVPSFAGEGMAMALHSAQLAADALLASDPASAYQARFAADVGLRVRWAARLSQAVTSQTGQGLAALVCRAFPHWLPGLARATRIPESVNA